MGIWKPVPEFEGTHEISDTGVVRSVDRVVNFSDGRVRPYTGKVMATYTDNFGYLKVTLKHKGRWVRVHVHVLVAAAFHGVRPAGLQVCHNDGNHLNNTAGNLRYDTPAANGLDTTKHGRRNPKKKYSDDIVAAVRAARGQPYAPLIAAFGMSAPHICSIQKGRRRP